MLFFLGALLLFYSCQLKKITHLNLGGDGQICLAKARFSAGLGFEPSTARLRVNLISHYNYHVTSYR